MAYPHADKLIEKLWPSNTAGDTSLYAILDGARNDDIYPAVMESQCEFECLYMGELEPDVAESAPYLIKLERDKPFTEWLLKEGWGDSWGIYVQTNLGMRELRRHFRKFLMVYDPEHKPLYFRYYDPRVLRIYLPTCNAEELDIVFGQIKNYILEDQNPEVLLRFANNSGTLAIETTGVTRQ